VPVKGLADFGGSKEHCKEIRRAKKYKVRLGFIKLPEFTGRVVCKHYSLGERFVRELFLKERKQ